MSFIGSTSRLFRSKSTLGRIKRRRKSKPRSKKGSKFTKQTTIFDRLIFMKSFDEHEPPKFSDLYKVEDEPIGKGSYGVVLKAYRITDLEEQKVKIPYAVKILMKESKDRQQLKALTNEVTAMKMISHPHIITFVKSFDEASSLKIVMEFCQGSGLQAIIKDGPATADFVRIIMFQLCSALSYCKSIGILHRDVKPSNMLVMHSDSPSPELKLIDFGFAAIIDLQIHTREDRYLDDWIGTVQYVSPEIVRKHAYNYKSDFWSVGVILFELFSGFRPFNLDETKRNARKKLMNNISEANYEYEPQELWTDVPFEGKDLISKLLVPKPEDRLNDVQTLKHPFFTSEFESKHKSIAFLEKKKKNNSISDKHEILSSYNTKIVSSFDSKLMRKDSDDTQDTEAKVDSNSKPVKITSLAQFYTNSKENLLFKKNRKFSEEDSRKGSHLTDLENIDL